MRTRSYLAVLLLTLSLPFGVFAQLIPDALARPLILTVSPEYPEPYSTVTASIESYALDLDRSSISWFLNGRRVDQGIGTRTLTLETGGLGTQDTLEVVAENEDGIVSQARAVIAPTDVDVVWEAMSYSPPFFKGRTLPGSNSTIRMQAISQIPRQDGSLIPESELVYSWYKNGALQRSLSGRGKSSAVMTGPVLFGTDTIVVTVEAADRSIRGRGTLNLVSKDTYVELYEAHPLFGILFNKPLSASSMSASSEQSLITFPFYANVSNPQEKSLTYEWRVNDLNIPPDPQTPNLLTVNAGGYTGPVKVQLSLGSASDWLMQAQGLWQFTFGDTGSNLFSGQEVPNNPFRSEN